MLHQQKYHVSKIRGNEVFLGQTKLEKFDWARTCVAGSVGGCPLNGGKWFRVEVFA